MADAGDGPDTRRGFWRWVKTPRLRRRADRERADEEAEIAALDPARVTDPEVVRLVEGLLTDALHWPATAKFETLGRRAVPALLRALSDRRYFRPRRGAAVRSLPVESVLVLLDNVHADEMTARVIELAGHPDPLVRGAAARSLGKLASPAVLPAWLAVSRDPDGVVRRSAVWGVCSALAAGRVAPKIAAGVFDRVAELLDDGVGPDTAQGAAEVLVRLDPARATAALTAPARFPADNPRLFDILKGADEHDFLLPPDRVSRLLDDLRPLADDYFAGGCIGFLLDQLARQQTPDARERTEAAAGWATPGSDGERQIAQAAAGAVARLSGASEPVNVVLARLAAGEPLSPEQRAFHVAWLCNAEVGNGGFAQYFVNSAGETAGDAAAAFERIGAPAHAELVRRAVALFGPAGPATDRDVRHDQLAALPPAADAELDRLSTDYYRTPGDVPTLLMRFAGRHADQFRAAGPTPTPR